MTQTIEQLQAKVAELEEENARLNSSPTIEACRQMIRDKAVIEASTLHEQLAAAQAEIKRLRDALSKCSEQLTRLGYSFNHADHALSQPTSTEALDAYVAEKVKEAYIPVTIDYGDGAEDVAFGNEHQARRLKKWLDKLFAQKEQIATITRQRDLAVYGLNEAEVYLTYCKPIEAMREIRKALSAIKESEAK